MSPLCRGSPSAFTDVCPAHVRTRECPLNSTACENPNASCHFQGLTGLSSICPPLSKSRYSFASLYRSALQTIELSVLLVALGDHPGSLYHNLCLFERRVVLHSAVEHHRAGAVTHGLDDTFGSLDLLHRRAELAPGDLDLRRV